MNQKHATQSQSQSCAACKHQRRKCAHDCPLAPYFPADRAKDFSNAHKLFGVGNILKVLKTVPAEARDEAMNSIMFHANAREADPVGGCYGIVLNLMKQIETCQTELDFVRHQLRAFRSFGGSGCSKNVSDRTYGVVMKPEEHRFPPPGEEDQ